MVKPSQVDSKTWPYAIRPRLLLIGCSPYTILGSEIIWLLISTRLLFPLLGHGEGCWSFLQQCSGERQGTSLAASSPQDPSQAWGGLVPCSRVPRHGSEGVLAPLLLPAHLSNFCLQPGLEPRTIHSPTILGRGAVLLLRSGLWLWICITILAFSLNMSQWQHLTCGLTLSLPASCVLLRAADISLLALR